MDSMEQWMKQRLSELLNFPIPDDLLMYIKEMENETDVENYLTELLDNENPKHKQFVADFKKRRAIHNQAAYKKTNDNENTTNKQVDKKKGKAKGKENVQTQETPKPEKPERKKEKFVNLLSHGDIILKGRHKCDCEAKRHALINNCLNCGRIVCLQEGAGPCLFCRSLVCSPKQQAILESNTKQANNLYNKLMDQKVNKGFEDSVTQRNKLLEFDRNSAHRTKVIDDESDYYQSNSTWLTAAEREQLLKQEEKAHARKHASRLDKRIAMDFMGRVVDADQFSSAQLEEYDETASHDYFDNPNICPTIEFDRPTFIEMGISEVGGGFRDHVTWNTESRIQDKEYLEMSDQALCLSIHQPYASVLVAGIKTHEGRTWYSSHRGRLWIASAAKVPSVEEISSLQNCYRILKDGDLKFPETYPTSCLLGCVTITNVLPQAEYRRVYPEGECSSPYVFICENPYVLPIPLPMKGKHKIYKMDRKLHQTASKYLERAMKTV